MRTEVRTPEASYNVLVATKLGTTVGRYYSNQWICDNTVVPDDFVVAWAELPQYNENCSLETAFEQLAMF